jgi:hexokinase
MLGLRAQRQSIAQVCGPSLCTQNTIMNAIAAHKDELEKLLENLSGDIAVSRIIFVALLDAYITRLDANCSDISARVIPPLAQINGELTWNRH